MDNISELKMDAIRKKLKSIKDETDQLYAIISKFENATKETESIAKEVKSCLRKIIILVESSHGLQKSVHITTSQRVTI